MQNDCYKLVHLYLLLAPPPKGDHGSLDPTRLPQRLELEIEPDL